MLILFIFLRVATLGGGNSLFVINFITDDVSFPEILITAIPEMPFPLDKANIVIIFFILYPSFINFVKLLIL